MARFNQGSRLETETELLRVMKELKAELELLRLSTVTGRTRSMLSNISEKKRRAAAQLH